EVKGSFCYQARQILAQHKRAADYLEIVMGSKVRYNPLHNDLHPYVLAYAMAALLNNIFGRGHEPFWQQAYTELVMGTVLIYRTLYDHDTLFDVYRAVGDPEELAARLKEGATKFQPSGESVNRVQAECLLVTRHDSLREPTLNLFAFDFDPESDTFRCRFTDELLAHLQMGNIPYEIERREIAVTPTV